MREAAPARTVAVVGGGLAGLAAACALAEVGSRVTVFERRPFLGGRASSYEHPGTGEVVDNCQHVLLGCCTNLIDFYRRIGVADRIRWYDRLTFIEPGGRRSVVEPSALPAPLHNAPAFLRSAMLARDDKVAIARAMLAFVRRIPPDDGRTFLDWLHAHGQPERAIARFWQPVLVSALNEDLDRVSIPYAALVFRESFMKSRHGGRMGLPSVPLGELYAGAGDFVRARGGQVHLRSAVESIQITAEAVTLRLGGESVITDFAVLAVPFDVLPRLLPDEPVVQPLRADWARFQTSPITGIHLWFDRQITELDHAVLLDRTIQWMFHKSKILARSPVGNTVSSDPDTGNWKPETGNSYVELVVSASKSLVDMPRQEIVDLAVRELREFFPDAANAQLVKATVIKEVRATFSPLPGSESYRPYSETPWRNVFLAGDWTRTGWPATMESAVRSGHIAAELVARATCRDLRFVADDLPPAGIMRLWR